MLADNIVFARTTELHSELRRLISVQKMRRSGFDQTLREFVITSQMLIDDPFANAEAIMTGQPRPRGAETDPHPPEAGTSTPSGAPS